MASLDDKMAVSLKQYFALHLPDLTTKQLKIAPKVIDALRKEKFKKLSKLLKNHDEQYKDSVLSLCARYLVFNNIPTTDRINSFLNDYLLRLRFYTSLKNDTAISIPPSKMLMDYMKNEMNTIVNWDGKTNLILLYHIKQILLNANGLIYDRKFKKLPWKQFVFYLQQYVRYFEVYDENHIFLLTFICLENLKLFVQLFLTSIESIIGKKPQSVKTIVKNNIEKFKKLMDVYEHIRDMYTLNRMEKYFIMWKEQHFKDKNTFSSLRVLQVIGESLKSTHATPSLSEELKQRIVKTIDTYNANKLINIRDELSHFTSLPYVLSKNNRSLYKELNDLIYTIENIVKYVKFEISMKLSKIIHKNDGKVEMPKGISTRKVFVLLQNDPNLENTYSFAGFINYDIAESHSSVCNALEYLLETDNILGIELIVMIKLNHLKKEEKRLNDNRGWMKDQYPTLSGIELRNHLAHGDPIVELLQIDEAMTIRNVAKLLLEDMGNGKDDIIQKMAQILEIEMQKIINERELTSLYQKQTTLDLIIEGDLDKVENQLQNVSPDWIHWRNERGENVLQLASRNDKDNLRLFEFVLDNNSDSLESENEIYMPLALALLKENKKIAKFILNKHIEKLLNIVPNDSKINYTEKLDNYLQENHKKLDEILTDRICFILCCFGISIDNDEFLKLLSKTIYWNSFENIFNNYDWSFFEILCLFDTTTIDQNRFKSGKNDLHIAIETEDVSMIETIYNKHPYFVVLRDEKQQTPLDVAINMKNEEILTTIIQLVIKNGVTETEMFKHVFNNLICTQFSNDKKYLVQELLYDSSLGNKLVLYWQLKFLNLTRSTLLFRRDTEIKLLKQLSQILQTYNYDKHFINEYAELLYSYIPTAYSGEREFYTFFKQLFEMFASSPCGSQVLIMLYKKIEYKYEFDGIHFCEVLIEMESEIPEILLFKIKLIYYFDMLTNKSKSKTILEALQIVAKQPSFNDLDDHTYYIWVDVFITTTAILNYKPVRETELDNNEDNIEVQLKNLLNDCEVKKEIKKQLLKMFSHNSKHLLISGKKNEIIEFFKNKKYMKQKIRVNCLLKYIPLNKNISWEDMKCIFDIEYFHEYEVNLQINFRLVEKSCLMVRNEAILEKLLEVSACHNLISKQYVTDEDIPYPSLKDYNINSIKELVNKLLTFSISYNLDEIESIIFYIIRSDNVIAFSKLISVATYVGDNFMVKITLFACQCGAIKILEYLINYGVNLNAYNDYDQLNCLLLYDAVKYDQAEIIQLLLKHGATNNYYYLLNKKELINTEKHHKLHKIIQTGNVEELKTFLNEEQGIEWRSSMETGDTCLHYAILSENEAMIEEVYSKCAHLTITKNYHGITPLDIIEEERFDTTAAFKTLINLVINDYPNRVNILHKYLQTFDDFNLSKEKAIWLLSQLINLLISYFDDIILNKTYHKIMDNITNIIRHHHDTIDVELMSRIIAVLERYDDNILRKLVVENRDTTLFNLLASIVLRTIQHPDSAARILDISKFFLEKFDEPNQVKYILQSISEEVMYFRTTHEIFTKYAVDAIKKFPNEQELQGRLMPLIYYAYLNGEKPQLLLDIIRNLLQSFANTMYKKEIEMKATIFAYYFIWHSNIEREHIDEVIDLELNNWRWTNLHKLYCLYIKNCFEDDDEKIKLAKKFFRDTIINLS